jgi:hypothetical protein
MIFDVSFIIEFNNRKILGFMNKVGLMKFIKIMGNIYFWEKFEVLFDGS